MRKLLRQQRKNVSSAYQYQASISVLHHLLKNNILRYKHIAIYSANDGELSTDVIINFLINRGQNIYLPILSGEVLKFARITKNTRYKRNKFGILEPINTRIVHPKKINLTLTPLVGFDKCGNRLGMGGGFYDKTFSFKRRQKYLQFPKMYGLAYDFQQTIIFPNPWDIQLGRIITQKHCINIIYKK